MLEGQKVESYTRRLRPGRPQPGDPYEWVSETRYSLKVSENAVHLRQEANTDGVFPIDCIIAQTCVEREIELLSPDADFRRIADHSPLRLP